MAEEPGTPLEQTGESDPGSAPAPEQTGSDVDAGVGSGQKDEIDDVAVNVRGQQMVPAAEVRKERDARRAAKEKAEKAQKELDDWKAKATPILQHLAQLQQTNPALIEAIRTGQLPQTQPNQTGNGSPQSNSPDPELTSLAQTLQLYTSDGQPDIEAAARIQEFADRRAKATASELVRQHVEPLAATTHSSLAQSNYQRLKSFIHQDGTTADPEFFDQWWTTLPDKDRQDPHVALTQYLAAVGHQKVMGRPFKRAQTTQSPPGPLMTDAAGGRGGRVRLTVAQENAAKDMGVSAKDFAAGIEKAMSNDGVLEEY